MRRPHNWEASTAVLLAKSSLLCRFGNFAPLADCMERMLDLSPEELAAMGRCGREYIEREFSEEIVLQAYLDQCERLLGKS